MTALTAHVARTRSGSGDRNTLVLPKLSHISVLLRSNSGAVPLANRPYRIELSDGRILEGTTDADGLVSHPRVPPGDYRLKIGDSFETTVPTMPTHISRRTLRVPDYLLFEEEGSYEDAEGLSADEGDEVDLNWFDEDDGEWEDVDDG